MNKTITLALLLKIQEELQVPADKIFLTVNTDIPHLFSEQGLKSIPIGEMKNITGALGVTLGGEDAPSEVRGIILDTLPLILESSVDDPSIHKEK